MGAQPGSSAGRVPLLASVVAVLGVSVLAVAVPQRAASSVAAAVPAPCRFTVVWLPPGGYRAPNRCEIVSAPMPCPPATAPAQLFVCNQRDE